MLGISEVRNTVERIKYIRNIEKEIKEALNSRLPDIKADRFLATNKGKNEVY